MDQKTIESVLTCLFKKKFNRRSNNLSVQAASYTFSEVVVEIRENGEKKQVIAVTCDFQFRTNIKVPLRENSSRQVLHKKARKSSPEKRRVQPKRGRGV